MIGVKRKIRNAFTAGNDAGYKSGYAAGLAHGQAEGRAAENAALQKELEHIRVSRVKLSGIRQIAQLLHYLADASGVE